MSKPTVSPYETCPVCEGSGLGLNAYSGEPGNCWTCHGYGTIRARDDKGRFVGNTTKETEAAA